MLNSPRFVPRGNKQNPEQEKIQPTESLYKRSHFQGLIFSSTHRERYSYVGVRLMASLSMLTSPSVRRTAWLFIHRVCLPTYLHVPMSMPSIHFLNKNHQNPFFLSFFLSSSSEESTDSYPSRPVHYLSVIFSTLT